MQVNVKFVVEHSYKFKDAWEPMAWTQDFDFAKAIAKSRSEEVTNLRYRARPAVESRTVIYVAGKEV